MAEPANGDSKFHWRDALCRLENGLLATLLTVMILLAAGQIILRNLFELGWPWIDPLLRLLVLWVGLLGALAASRDAKHITIDALVRIMPVRLKHAALALAGAFTTVVSGLIAWSGARFVAMERTAESTAFADLPIWVMQLIIPVAFGLIAVRYLLHSIDNARSAWMGKGS